MARRRKSGVRWVVDLFYLAVVTGIWGLGAWVFYERIAAPETETLSWTLSAEGRQYTFEMLEPFWLCLALLVPPIWLLRKWTLIDLPWIQRVLNALLRSLLLLSLCLAVTRIVVTDYESRVGVVFLVDVSESVPDDLLAKAHEHIQAVWDARGENDVRVVTFAREGREVPIPPNAETVPELLRHEGDAGLESNLGPALRLAYGLFPQDHLRRAVIISDGNLNRGDALSEIFNASRYGIRVYAQSFDYEREDEVLIRAVDFPDEVRANEPFHITVDVFSTYDGQITLDLFQNEYQDIDGRPYPVTANETVQLNDPPVIAEVYEPGLRNFEVVVRAERDDEGERRDRFRDNNRFVHVLEVRGRPQVLYVEGESRRSTYLSRALDDERNSRVDFDLDVRSAGGFPNDVDEMRNFDLIILSDVPASELSRSSMTALRQYVREGGSFLMVGGEDSFGPGGYQGTIMEEILPVTFEARRQETMPSVALLLVIDRSGSMEGEKLRMAIEAARAAVELLGPQDRVGVIAFDVSPQTVVRLQSASNRVRINNDIGRVRPGGGTDILPALEEAWVELAGTSARIKHVILLTDGEAPYDGIAEVVGEMRRDRITVSTVALGRDADRDLLEMIADLSGGRDYYTPSASEIPQIFIQETSQVARTSLMEEPFRPRVVTDSAATRGIDFASAPYLLGYVSTRARRRATVGLETELGEPLYAWWRYGRGRTAVFTSDCKNRWMVEWIREPIYPRFWAQLVDHLMRPQEEEEERLDMTVSTEGGQGRVTVDVIAEDDSFVNGVESTVTITFPSGEERAITLEQTAAGRYEGTFELAGYGAYLLEAVHRKDGEELATSLASLNYAYPDEYLDVEDDLEYLAQAVRLSQGSVDPEIAELFDPGDERIASKRDLWPYFAFAALGLLMLDLLLRRVRVYGRMALDWNRVTGRG